MCCPLKIAIVVEQRKKKVFPPVHDIDTDFQKTVSHLTSGYWVDQEFALLVVAVAGLTNTSLSTTHCLTDRQKPKSLLLSYFGSQHRQKCEWGKVLILNNCHK